jgi:hypothetical protein
MLDGDLLYGTDARGESALFGVCSAGVQIHEEHIL